MSQLPDLVSLPRIKNKPASFQRQFIPDTYNLSTSEQEELRSAFRDVISQVDIPSIVNDFSHKGYSLRVLRAWGNQEWKSAVRDVTVRCLLRQCVDSTAPNCVDVSHLFAANPPVLHFSGFGVSSRASLQTVHIVNTSRLSRRFNIFPPTTEFFKIKFSKCGDVAPGMSQDIQVFFTPNSYRYFYDVIRVSAESGELFIPLHAYPKMNDRIFPSHIELGTCHIGDKLSRIVALENNVPIEFQFSFSVIESCADIQLEPLSGIVPPNGSTSISITYQPTRVSTSSAKFELFLSQFAFDPMICEVSASCALVSSTASNVERKKLLKKESSCHDRPPIVRLPKSAKENDSFSTMKLYRQERDAQISRWRLTYDFLATPDCELTFAGDSISSKRKNFDEYLRNLTSYENELKIRPSASRIGHALLSEENITHLKDIKNSSHHCDYEIGVVIGPRDVSCPEFKPFVLRSVKIRSHVLHNFVQSVSVAVHRQRVLRRLQITKPKEVKIAKIDFSWNNVSSNSWIVSAPDPIFREQIEVLDSISPFTSTSQLPLLEEPYKLQTCLCVLDYPGIHDFSDSKERGLLLGATDEYVSLHSTDTVMEDSDSDLSFLPVKSNEPSFSKILIQCSLSPLIRTSSIDFPEIDAHPIPFSSPVHSLHLCSLLSDHWRVRFENRFHPRYDGPNHIPSPPIFRLNSNDVLSESDSDDEQQLRFRPVLPTKEQARRLFLSKEAHSLAIQSTPYEHQLSELDSLFKNERNQFFTELDNCVLEVNNYLTDASLFMQSVFYDKKM